VHLSRQTTQHLHRKLSQHLLVDLHRKQHLLVDLLLHPKQHLDQLEDQQLQHLSQP
jgi:hypothetical protein